MSGVQIFSGDGVGKDLVVLREDGTKIEGISELTIRYAVGEIPYVELTLKVDVINLAPEPGMTTHKLILPCCGQDYLHECDGP